MAQDYMQLILDNVRKEIGNVEEEAKFELHYIFDAYILEEFAGWVGDLGTPIRGYPNSTKPWICVGFTRP